MSGNPCLHWDQARDGFFHLETKSWKSDRKSPRELRPSVDPSWCNSNTLWPTSSSITKSVSTDMWSISFLGGDTTRFSASQVYGMNKLEKLCRRFKIYKSQFLMASRFPSSLLSTYSTMHFRYQTYITIIVLNFLSHSHQKWKNLRNNGTDLSHQHIYFIIDATTYLPSLETEITIHTKILRWISTDVIPSCTLPRGPASILSTLFEAILPGGHQRGGHHRNITRSQFLPYQSLRTTYSCLPTIPNFWKTTRNDVPVLSTRLYRTGR